MFRKNPLYDVTGRPFVLQEASAARQAKKKKDHLNVVIHASTFDVSNTAISRSTEFFPIWASTQHSLIKTSWAITFHSIVSLMNKYHSHQLQAPKIENKFPHINHPLKTKTLLPPEKFHGNHSKLGKKIERERETQRVQYHM